jgi:hypothetical protein
MFPPRKFTRIIGNDMAPGTGKASALHTMHAFLYSLFSHPVAKGMSVNFMGWISGAAWMVSSRDSGVTIPWNWWCGLLPLSNKLLSVHAINTTPHRPSRISHLSVTFEILLASFRPVNSIFYNITHTYISISEIYAKNTFHGKSESQRCYFIFDLEHLRAS